MYGEELVAPCHRLLLLCLWSVICARAPKDIQVEVHVKRLSQVKMTLESMFMKNISAVIEDTQHPVHVRGVPIMKNHSFLVG